MANYKLLTITSDPDAGGSSKSLLTLLKVLKQKGWIIQVELPAEGFLSRELAKADINYKINKYIRVNAWPPLKSFIDTLLFIPRLCRNILFLIFEIIVTVRQVKAFSPDLIYTNTSTITSGYVAAIMLKKKHIWHIREYGDKDFNITYFPNNKLKRQLLQSTPSISITKEINSYFQLENTGKVIYNGIEINNIIGSVTYPANSYLLYVGRICKEKGCTELIEAYIEYVKSGGRLNLVLCGSYMPRYFKEIQKKIFEYPVVKDKILFEGHVSNINKYMVNAKALVVPSFYEGFGRITAEAMFYKCLIIGRNTGGTKEQLDLGLNFTCSEIGLRFDNINSLTSALLNVDNMTLDEIQGYKDRAYLTASNYFSKESYTNKVMEYFKSIISSKGRF